LPQREAHRTLGAPGARADGLGFWSTAEEDRTLRAVLVAMLKESDRWKPRARQTGAPGQQVGL